MRHEFIRVNGLRFHYVEAGQGPLVVLLHGFPQFWYAWRKQIPALARRFRVVAPDLRGYGESERPTEVSAYAASTLASDVAGLIFALGEKKARVVGHDWGGGVAWTLAQERPEVVDKLAVLNCPHPTVFLRRLRGAQLVRSWYMLFFQLPWLPEWALLRDQARVLGGLFRGSSARPEAFTEEDLRAYREAALKPGAMTAALNYYRAAFRDRAGRKRAIAGGPKIAAPTMLIWGERDQALGKELTVGMEPLFSGPFELRYLPDASHWVNEEQPETVNELLLEFFSREIPLTVMGGAA